MTRFRSFRRLWVGAHRSALWLDIGCGAGTYARFLAEEGPSVIGIDYSLPTLQKARARSASGISWVTGDATRLPIREGSIDVVLCFGVLQAVAATEPVLQAKLRSKRRRTRACTWAMAWASSPEAAAKITPPAAAASNTPSMTTQWKCRCALRVEPKRWDEGDRTEARRGARTRAVRAQAGLHGAASSVFDVCLIPQLLEHVPD